MSILAIMFVGYLEIGWEFYKVGELQNLHQFDTLVMDRDGYYEINYFELSYYRYSYDPLSILSINLEKILDPSLDGERAFIRGIKMLPNSETLVVIVHVFTLKNQELVDSRLDVYYLINLL